jgi:hypothetical protein
LTELREHLSSALALEYWFTDHATSLPRKPSSSLIWNICLDGSCFWSIRTKVDATQLEDIAPRIINECVTPIVLHLQRNEADSWDAIRTSEDERLFREAQALMGRRTLADTSKNH